jgi:hypothetical protein
MYSNFQPTSTATSTELASYVSIPDQPGIGEMYRFFDLHAWDPLSIDTSLSLAPHQITFGVDEHMSQPHGTVHDARDLRSNSVFENDNLASNQGLGSLSVDAANSDLVLGQPWQSPAMFDASITLDDLNALDRTAPNHSIAADDNSTSEDIVAFDDYITPRVLTATNHIDFAMHEPVSSEASRAEAFPICARNPPPPGAIVSNYSEHCLSPRSVAPKLKRTRISKAAKKILDEHFRSNPYPREAETSTLMRATQLTSRTIKDWFTNTRSRMDLMKCEINRSDILQFNADNTLKHQSRLLRLRQARYDRFPGVVLKN